MANLMRRQEERHQVKREQAQARARELAAEVQRAADELAERARTFRARANGAVEERARRPMEAAIAYLAPLAAAAVDAPNRVEPAASAWARASAGAGEVDGVQRPTRPLSAAAAVDGLRALLSPFAVPAAPTAPTSPVAAAPRSLTPEAALRRQAGAAGSVRERCYREPSGEQRRGEGAGGVDEGGAETTAWERQAYLWPAREQQARERQ